MNSLFIIISAIGAVGAYFLLPETKGIPLEEMAKLFGDTEHIVVFSDAIHVDHNTHELVVDEKGGLHHVATEADRPSTAKHAEAAHVERV